MGLLVISLKLSRSLDRRYFRRVDVALGVPCLGDLDLCPLDGRGGLSSSAMTAPFWTVSPT